MLPEIKNFIRYFKFNEVGLHFDKSIYEKISTGFKNELDQLSNIIGKKFIPFQIMFLVSTGCLKNIKNLKVHIQKIFNPTTYISDSRYEYKKIFQSFKTIL